MLPGLILPLQQARSPPRPRSVVQRRQRGPQHGWFGSCAPKGAPRASFAGTPRGAGTWPCPQRVCESWWHLTTPLAPAAVPSSPPPARPPPPAAVLLIFLPTWLRKAKTALQGDRATRAVCSCSTASAPSRGITKNLRGCSIHPWPPTTSSARPLRLQRGIDRPWRGLMATCKSPRRARHPGWGEEEDLAAGSRGISSDLWALKERGAKLSLLGLQSCGRSPPRGRRVPL